MNIDRNAILAKVKALAAMADPERNPNPHEVAVAASKMQELMDQYNISMLDVMAEATDNRDTFTEKSCEGILGQTKQWHWGLARVIARITSTRHFSTGAWGVTLREKHSKTEGKHKGSRMTFFGSKGSVEFACELFDKWVVRIDDMSVKATSEFIKERMQDPDVIERMQRHNVKQYRHLKYLGSDHPNAFRTSWLLGVIIGIDNALYEQEQARKKTKVEVSYTKDSDDGSIHRGQKVEVHTSTALAVFTEKLEVAYHERAKHFRTVNSRGSGNTNYGAIAQGKAVGAKINLTSKELKG